MIEKGLGEDLVHPEDFDGPMDVIPVSDPAIFSETQRFAQIQAVQQRATALPMVYDVRKVEELFLKQLKIPEAGDLLIPKPEPKDMDPIQENVGASVGKPIGALPHQDHIAHLKVHLSFLQSPFFGSNPMIAPMFLPAIVAHIKDHWLMHYMKMSVKGIDLAEKNNMVDGQNEMEQADAAIEIQKTIEQVIPQEFLDIMAKAFEEAQKYQQQVPKDPTLATVEVQKEAIEQRRESDQLKLQAQAAKSQQDAQLKAQEQAMKAQEQARQDQADMQEAILREDREDARTQQEIMARVAMNNSDNETAKELAAVEVASGENFSVSTGTGINP
jgi:hypothetical protein